VAEFGDPDTRRSPIMTGAWQDKRNDALIAAAGTDEEALKFAKANADAIDGVVNNIGLDPGSKASGGARVVFNMSNANIPTFCRTGYKNSYNLGKTVRIGEQPPGHRPTRRETVDAALEVTLGIDPRSTYFGAVELTGSGVRFYGDYCLVLKDPRLGEPLLDRNSYDIARPPLATSDSLDTEEMERSVAEISGTWDPDLKDILVVKTFSGVRAASRRLTLGQIAGAVLDDEDYVEVLRQGPFVADEVAEVRTLATDAAREAAIADRTRHRPMPSAAELLWRRRRLEAEEALATEKLSVRIITTLGRVR
jgi:hypothetical protein